MKYRTLWLLALLFHFANSGCDQIAEEPGKAESYKAGGCLYYLSRAQEDFGIVRFCGDDMPENILTEMGIQAYDLAPEVGKIAYSQIQESGKNGIYTADGSGNAIQEIVNCGTDRCESLVITPRGSTVYYSRYGKRIGLFAVESDSKAEMQISASFPDLIDISPNGQYLRFHETDTGLLRIMSTETLDLVLSFPADTDLVGGWLPDSSGFLMGERNVDGQLLISQYMEIDIRNQTQQQVFTLPKGVEYFRPIYADREQIFLLSRSGVRNNSREIQLIARSGEVIKTITNDIAYDHSSLQWDSVNQQLAFQRYDITRSDSVPEIMIWREDAVSPILVAQNAVQPQWR